MIRELPRTMQAMVLETPRSRLRLKELPLPVPLPGQVICGGIHMSDIPTFPYHLLWEERSIRSVANLTRKDGHLLLKTAAEAKVTTTIQQYKLSQANEALEDLRRGLIKGAAVLTPDQF